MKDLTRTMEIMKEAEEVEEAEAEAEGPKTETHDTAPSAVSNEEKKHFVAPEPGTDTTPAATPASATPVTPGTSEASTPSRSETSTPRPKGVPTRLMLSDKSDEDIRLETDMTEQERELKRKEKKKGGLSKEQRDELDAYEAERKKVRQERVDTLTRKLIDRISVWTETDKGKETTHAFNEKTKYEVENLKMESFGIDILHGAPHSCTCYL
jgi:hypothetical protein